jgi:hypothetical protein
VDGGVGRGGPHRSYQDDGGLIPGEGIRRLSSALAAGAEENARYAPVRHIPPPRGVIRLDKRDGALCMIGPAEYSGRGVVHRSPTGDFSVSIDDV